MMQRQKILFWSVVGAFLVAAFSYTAYIFKGSTPTVDFAKNTEQFEKTGVPDFTLPVFDSATAAPSGQRVHLADVHSKLIILNFWASWCAPCLKEYPSLVSLSKRYAKSGDQVRIIAVAVDTDLKGLSTFIVNAPVPAPSMTLLTDPQGLIAREYGTKKLPETYIIGKDHKLIRKVISDQDWMSPSLINFLDGLLRTQN